MRKAFRPGGPPRREVEEELAFHLDVVAAELEREGWPPDAARAEAERRFGDVGFTTEYCAESTARRRREGWTMRWDELRQDLTFALRTLGRSPGYAAVVVVTLTVAIAASATVFGVMSPYFVRPLPYGGAERLVQLGLVDPESGYDGVRFSLPMIEDLRERGRPVAAVASYHYGTVNLADEGNAPVRVQASVLSAEMFRVLDVAPALGRTFGPEEVGPAREDVVVLSDALWRARYAADPGILGRSIRVDGRPRTVIGVMGPAFTFPFNGIRMWIPDRRDPTAVERGRQNELPVVRLADGWTPGRAAAELSRLQGELALAHPDVDGRFDGVSVTPLREALNFAWQPLRVGFAILLGSVGFLLLVACVNVAGLALARATARGREIAVRTALGAGKGRLVRQLLTESLVLSAAAGLAGALLAALAIHALAPLLPEDLYRVGDAAMDARVILFTAAVTLSTPLVFGLAPAWTSARVDLAAAMKDGGGGGEAPGRVRGRKALVVAQVALAVVLVSGAGLTVRSFLSIRALDLGFDPERLLVIEVTPPATSYPGEAELGSYYGRAVERVEALPGVEGVGTVAWLPMNHETLTEDYALPGSATLRPEAWPSAQYNRVGVGYFHAMGVRLVAGRPFLESDDAGAPPVAIVSRRMAQRAWPDRSPVGATLYVEGRDGDAQPVLVVGVAADVQHSDELGSREPMLYRPLLQQPVRRRFLVVRTAEPASMVAPVRAALLELDPDLPLTLRPMPLVVRESTVAFSLGAGLMSGFGVLALLLAALGLSGLLAYTVALRRRELGVRLALGATPGRLRRMVLGEGLRLVALGAGAGLLLALGLALGLGPAIGAAVPRADPADPVTLAAGLAVLVGVAATASWLAAIRGRMDPSEALRGE